MAIITRQSFAKIRKTHDDSVVVYCDGSFDLTHAGHVLFFEDCKSYGDVLVVGVGADSDLRKYKGKSRPILNQHIRLKMVDSLKPVDYCFLNKVPDHKNLLSPLEFNFSRLRPDVYVINEDAFNIEYRRKIADKYKIKLIIAKRICPANFEKISTTGIIGKVKNS